MNSTSTARRVKQVDISRVSSEDRASLEKHGVALQVVVSDNDIYGDDGRPADGYLSCSLNLVVQAEEEAIVTCDALGVAEIVPPGMTEIEGNRWGWEQEPLQSEHLPEELVIIIEISDGRKRSVVCPNLRKQVKDFGYDERQIKVGVLELTPA